MTPDSQHKPTNSPSETGPGQPDLDRKTAARRRFLRIGAQGSAALVVTVAHRRTFAGIKNNVMASNCASLQGTPDLKNSHRKKGLETSAMGTPKGLMCRPRPPADDPNKIGNCTPSGQSEYYQFPNDGGRVSYVDDKELKKGCGSILPDAMPPNNTITASYNYRLYEKGYCPIVFDNQGLRYDLNATYYKKDGGNFILKQCKGP
jgi:hypothetical protein